MIEDPRKTALKNGIRQLTNEQIQCTIDYKGDMAVDHGNFVNGCYCPLAIGVGLDKIAIKNPTNDSVSAILCLMGYKVNNTRGIKGEFFTTNRLEDYKIAAKEVISERLHQDELIKLYKDIRKSGLLSNQKEFVDQRIKEIKQQIKELKK